MTFGENPRKVRNIVDGNLKAFKELYYHKIQVRKLLIPMWFFRCGSIDVATLAEFAIHVALDL